MFFTTVFSNTTQNTEMNTE